MREHLSLVQPPHWFLAVEMVHYDRWRRRIADLSRYVDIAMMSACVAACNRSAATRCDRSNVAVSFCEIRLAYVRPNVFYHFEIDIIIIIYDRALSSQVATQLRNGAANALRCVT